MRKKEVQGKKVELYACSNAHWKTEDGELFEPTADSTCSFRIWQNALRKYGKYLKRNEVRNLLLGQEVTVTLYSRKYGKKIAYEKYIALDFEYGVSIVWDIDIAT